MHRLRSEARLIQRARQAVAPDLGVHEHDRCPAFATQFTRQRRRLLARGHDPRLVRDRGGGAAARSYLDERGIGRQLVRKPHHLFRHRC